MKSDYEKQGKTSVGYRVEVFKGKVPNGDSIFSTLVTFVNVDEEGGKQEIC